MMRYITFFVSIFKYFFSQFKITIYRLCFIYLISTSLLSQNTYDKSFYLIDIKPDFVFDKTDKHDIDSILKLYHHTKNDTLRLNYLRLFAEGLTNEYLWTRYNNYLFKYTSKRKDSLYEAFNASALNNLGYESQYINNDIERSKKFYSLAYYKFKSINNNDGVGVEVNNLAYIYQHEGNIQKSIELYMEAAKLFEKSNSTSGLVSIYVNLGDIYLKNEELVKAEEFFNKALVYALSLKMKLVTANVYNQLGVVNAKNNNRYKAIIFYNKAFQIYQLDKNFNKIALLSLSLANNYNMLKDTILYRKNIFTAYENALLSSNIDVKARVYDFVATYYLSQNNYSKALVFADSSYMFAKKMAYPQLILDAAQKLSNIYHHNNNPELAYKYLYEVNSLKDSINSNVSKKAIVKSQFQLEYNKKEIQLKSEQDKKDILRRNEKKQQQTILVITIITLLIISVFACIAFINYRKTQKANVIIEKQKLEVELKNEEITIQKDIVEEKQKEILDSINYAQRIQQAVLTGDDVWRKVSKEYFILFNPKDIVSGDFYWAYNTPNNRSIFALADCTGHGVPGGFMSMLGNSFLNEIVIENKLFKADQILNKLRAKIIGAMEQKGMAQQRDGMDISLCVWNKLDNTLEFSGANNPLWLLRGKELFEYKADKMPIGSYLETEVPFSSTVISLEKGDIMYLSTDGYADQFGGPKGKKYKYKPLIEFLIQNNHLSMGIQKTLLEANFYNWKQNLEQIDDVSIVGIRV